MCVSVVRVVNKGAPENSTNCSSSRRLTSRLDSGMPQDQPQTISVTDLDIAQLADVKKQLEEVRVIETRAIILSYLLHP